MKLWAEKNAISAAVGLLYVACLVAWPVAASALERQDFVDIRLTPEETVKSGELGLGASEMAEVLRIRPYVNVLRDYRAIAKHQPASRVVTQARLLCAWRILQASQEVRRLVAKINQELAISYISLDSLNARKEMVTNVVTATNFAQFGVINVISKSTAIAGYPRTSNYERIVTDSMAIGLSVFNLLEGPKLFSRRESSPPNALANFLKPGFRPLDADQSFLWRFLDSQKPGSNIALTRRELLVKHWQAFAGLDASNARELRRVAALPEPNEQLSENLDVLGKRIFLLQDLKSHVEELDSSLNDLHRAVEVDADAG